MLRKLIPLAIFTLGMLLQTSPAPLRALDLGPAGLGPVSLPSTLASVKLPTTADFNGDGSPESLVLADGRLTITSGSRPAWQSPAGWTVVQAEITDLNHDGAPEATLLVWRPFHPWPVDQWLPYGGRIAGFHNNEGNSCHIILIGWRGGEYDDLWAGSALAEPVRSFAAADLDGDQKQELVTIEGRYADPISAPARKLKVWEWNGFGFTVVSSVEGTFYKMALAQSIAGHILILIP
jgi:hypothetical protein